MKTKILIGMLAASWLVSAADAQVTVGTLTTNSLFEPCGVAADSAGNFYIADSADNRIATIAVNTSTLVNLTGQPGQAGTNDGPVFQAAFSDPEGILSATVHGTNGLIIADTGNHTIRFVNIANGSVITLAGSPTVMGHQDGAAAAATFSFPIGLSLDSANNLYIADSGNNAIRVMNLVSMTVSTLTVPNTTFYQPNGVAVGDSNQVWVADTRNHSIKLITLSTPASGTMTTLIGSNNRSVSGTADNAYGANVRFNNPRGLMWMGDTTGLLISDTGNHTLRIATNYAIIDPTNYAVATFAGKPGLAGDVDGAAMVAQFNSPFGMASDPFGNDFLIADMNNNAIRRIQNGPFLGPVSAPVIGWAEYDYAGIVIFHTNAPFTFNNDPPSIAVAAEENTDTYFTWAPTSTNPAVDNVPDPSNSSLRQTAPPFQPGGTLLPNTIASPNIMGTNDFTIKTISTEKGRLPSPVVEARFIFVTANPQIVGNNAAQFTVAELTEGAQMWYTTNGTAPTNGYPSIGPVTNGNTINLEMGNKTNLTFLIQAFRPNYATSDVISNLFQASAFIPNQITFGFQSGEASSSFVGSAGQVFYAPVTLTLLPNATMYSLQFNLGVTNLTGPAVAYGAVNFESYLEEPVPSDPTMMETIPPAMFISYAVDPPPPADIIDFHGTNFVSLEFLDTNSGANLLGVGWLERYTQTNLYNTLRQDLITYSQPHDTTFHSSGGKVVVGGFTFQIPNGAPYGSTYQIQIGRPSATDDGIGAPDSDVFINPTVIGSLSNGPINSIKIVTVGQEKYVAGDVYPFKWFNAGDFGDTNLDNADVMQVFQSAVYSLNYPPPASDFFDGMDSCCVQATSVNSGSGSYLIPGTSVTGAGQDPLYDGNNTAINSIVFGDGVLDVSDVYVTFRRSLDPSLTWYVRFWTNGVRGAVAANGNPPTSLVAPAVKSAAAGDSSPGTGGTVMAASPTNYVVPGVSFTAGDAITGPGQTLSIPITATVFGNYPLRVLMLNLTVEPLDGSPAITNQVVFTPVKALGAPTLSMTQAPDNYAAAWLDSTIAGLTGTAAIGTLQITLPPNAPTNSAYAVHFEHASGSPNGVSSFPKSTFTGLITLADRSGSSWHDGIPDSWRLRYFGMVSNVLSAATADADGDGVPNSAEYAAGTDPTDSKSFLHVSSQTYAAQSFNLHWPSVAGKTYIIESSPTLFGGTWTPVATNTGTGGDMQIQDDSGGQHQFYRVRVAQ